MCPAGVIRLAALLFMLLGTWVIIQTYFDRSWRPRSTTGTQAPRHECGNRKGCPRDHFAFRLISGAANVVGPSICFNDQILMSNVRNNIGRGLNIALVNGGLQSRPRGSATRQPCPESPGDIKELETFLTEIKSGTVVLTATFDDPATKMTDTVRTLFTELGSSFVSNLGFRDNWVFLGAKGLNAKSPFEEHIKNNKETNKYDGWPELLELEGCAPRKVD
uniref:Family with sequence similarity 3 member D n=1 Tax=Nothoprocta perdicaria TaxID=30464 RepID=A0A8C6YTP4_NOTPE